jgi:membrane protein required for colicin V production
MQFSYFDIVISIIILLLGLKGLINGFFKEIFGLIGIIGGIFVASRLGSKAGEAISSHVITFTNQTATEFTGFLLVFALFWLVMIGIGYAFKKLSSFSGFGPVDRILGFVVGSGKFFLILSVIMFAVYNIKVFRVNIEPMMKHSVVFPALVATGGYIMKVDPTKTANDINTTTVGSALKQSVVNTEANISNELNKSLKTDGTH